MQMGAIIFTWTRDRLDTGPCKCAGILNSTYLLVGLFYKILVMPCNAHFFIQNYNIPLPGIFLDHTYTQSGGWGWVEIIRIKAISVRLALNLPTGTELGIKMIKDIKY